MVIEEYREITKEEAKEWTCVLFNAARLIKNPTKKPSNVFSFCVKATIFIAVAILFFGFFLLSGDRDVYTLTGAIVTCVSVLFLIIFAVRVNQVYQTFLKRGKEHVIMTLDEKGIDYEVVDNQRFQTAWSNVSFIRVFQQAIYIFPKDVTGVIYGVKKGRLEELKTFLKESQIDLQIFE